MPAEIEPPPSPPVPNARGARPHGLQADLRRYVDHMAATEDWRPAAAAAAAPFTTTATTTTARCFPTALDLLHCLAQASGLEPDPDPKSVAPPGRPRRSHPISRHADVDII